MIESMTHGARRLMLRTFNPPRAGLIEEVRETAIDNGAAWLRGVLDGHGAERLSDLPDDTLRAALA